MKIKNIPLLYVETDFPQIPFLLPIHSIVNINSDKISIYVERTGSLAADESGYFEINKNDIIKVEAIFLPELSEEDLELAGQLAESSQLIIYQKDPYEIVEYFTHKFESNKHYWIKAVVKYLKEDLKINVITVDKING